jgi:cyclopropane-fatty-acyl-phospholipid synthase
MGADALGAPTALTRPQRHPTALAGPDRHPTALAGPDRHPTADEARLATNRHYELPTEFFAAYLDRRLKYSSGLYQGPDTTLEEAQTAKLHFVAQRLGVSPGCRLLDIGCGWGSLVLFMAAEYGCQVTGVTPSAPQAAHITGRAGELGVADRVRIERGSFGDLDLADRYDAVSMLGSIIHMPDRTEVLKKVKGLLRQGGALYLSESCFRSWRVYEEFAARPGTRHVTEGIFGFADMVPLSALVESVESAGLSLTGLTDLTAHYLRTTTDWETRALANRDAIEAAAPGMFDPLIQYLQTASAGWGYTTKHYALTAVKSRLGPEQAP